jgi:hypothetical protein
MAIKKQDRDDPAKFSQVTPRLQALYSWVFWLIIDLQLEATSFRSGVWNLLNFMDV